MRFPVGPNSVSLGLGYFERVKLSHIFQTIFYFIQFAFLHFHTSYFVNFFQQIFYYDSFILTLTLKKTDT
ncbi:hypothetical protein T4D_7467 [Trichinella pseudospiralis]|uniref:Uncharacterized protein n=1 Tax=Trichinella pseudospiralis TaxID=6337 RepID=A0A0V1F569_TRIPS|nr:hypothetical protein T4D_7467 [Trichinella pseudospiralis]